MTKYFQAKLSRFSPKQFTRGFSSNPIPQIYSLIRRKNTQDFFSQLLWQPLETKWYPWLAGFQLLHCEQLQVQVSFCQRTFCCCFILYNINFHISEQKSLVSFGFSRGHLHMLSLIQKYALSISIPTEFNRSCHGIKFLGFLHNEATYERTLSRSVFWA